jgi:hypothetical protein
MIAVPMLPVVFRATDGIAELSPEVNCVYMDPVTQTWEPIAQWFAYYHELGHILFPQPKRGWKLEIEKKCDAYAAERLLAEGCTGAEIKWAMKRALKDSEESRDRMKYVKYRLLWM